MPAALFSGGPDGSAVDAAIGDLEYFEAQLLEGRWPGALSADEKAMFAATGTLRDDLTQWVSVTPADESSWSATLHGAAAVLGAAEDRMLKDLRLPVLKNGDPFGSAAAPSVPSAQAELSFSGSGAVQTRTFTTVGGLTIFRAACRCPAAPSYLPDLGTNGGIFTVTVDAASGTAAVPISVSATDGYSGSAAAHLPAGTYYLLVQANGPWSIEMTQAVLSHRQLLQLPQRFTGEGEEVIGPLASGTTLAISVSNRTTDPSSQFSLAVYSASGKVVGTPFNRYGTFTGSATLHGVHGGPYYIAVSSDGDWVVTVQGPVQVI